MFAASVDSKYLSSPLHTFRLSDKTGDNVQVVSMRLMKSTGLILATLAIASCGQTDRNDASSDLEGAGQQAAQLTDISGSWSLDSASSKIAFASIKAGEIGEVHYFYGLSGEVSGDGGAVVNISLDDVETKIDQRNERMRSLFFETDSYPIATVSATVDADAFSDLPIGGRLATELDGTLSLHGVEAPVYADVFVTRIAQSRVEVATSEPVIVYVSDFNLDVGLEALREVAVLPSITPAVPVTFTFVFDASNTE